MPDLANADAKVEQPLGMTVHSLPLPEGSLTGDNSRTARGRWRMLAVLLVCAAPVIASYLTYYLLRPEGRRNFGELISSQRLLPDQLVQDLNGKSSNLRALKGQWLLLSVASAACPESCAHNLYLQRQLREGLGRDKDRLDWVWLLSDDAPVAEALRSGLVDATVLRMRPDQIAGWLEPAANQSVSEHLYLVDPQGHWMMRFPPNLDLAGAAKVKRDLERLLRASASWDKAGR